MTRVRLVLLGATCAALVACGARTSLEVDGAETTGSGGLGSGGQGGAGVTTGPGSGGDPTSTSVSSTTSVTVGVTTTSAPLCFTDEDCDDGVDCTVDTCEPSGCTSAPTDVLCDDGLLCTFDVCDPNAGCTSSHSDGACDDGIPCTVDTCDDATDTCENDPCDGQCDNGVFCDGVERCDSQLGCVQGATSCDVGVACASSSCNEQTQVCTHDFPTGCAQPDVHLLVTDGQGRLWDVTPFGTGMQQLIAPGGAVHLDIAVLDGRWFVMDQSLRELYPGTNTVKANIAPIQLNSLGGGPDHMLYAAGTSVFRINPNGGQTTYLGDLPVGHSSSGDLAFVGDRLFISTDSPCGGALVEFDPVTGQSSVLGGDGLGCVYGLANVGGVLYVVNCDGKIGSFDPDTGEARIFATTSVSAYGADALP